MNIIISPWFLYIMDQQKYHYTITNNLPELSALNESINSLMKSLHIPEETVYAIALAIDEMGTNCVKYSFDDTNIHQIEVDLSIDPNHVVLVIKDDGHEFDPLKAFSPDTSLPMEERPIGGLGIHLVRSSVNQMIYKRIDNINILEIVVNYSSAK